MMKLKSHKYYDLYEVKDYLKTIGWTEEEIEVFEDLLSPQCNGDLCYLFTTADEDDFEPEQNAIIEKWNANGLPKNPRISFWW